MPLKMKNWIKSEGLTSDWPWIDAASLFFLLKVMPSEKVAAF